MPKGLRLINYFISYTYFISYAYFDHTMIGLYFLIAVCLFCESFALHN